MAHDPIGLFTSGSYEDSLTIQLDKIQAGVIFGKDIPSPKGYYNYAGEVTIEGDKMTVELFYDNYDDKRLDPLSWNGTYELVDPGKSD